MDKDKNLKYKRKWNFHFKFSPFNFAIQFSTIKNNYESWETLLKVEHPITQWKNGRKRRWWIWINRKGLWI